MLPNVAEANGPSVLPKTPVPAYVDTVLLEILRIFLLVSPKYTIPLASERIAKGPVVLAVPTTVPDIFKVTPIGTSFRTGSEPVSDNAAAKLQLDPLLEEDAYLTVVPKLSPLANHVFVFELYATLVISSILF
jgi:hypothetical protein